MTQLTLQWLAGEFAIHRFSAETPLPANILTTQFVSITRTAAELSIVAPAEVTLASDRAETGWTMFMFVGQLDFSLTGILARVAQCLAAVDVSIFAISTFDTDYVMIKQDQRVRAEVALRAAGYQFQ